MEMNGIGERERERETWNTSSSSDLNHSSSSNSISLSHSNSNHSRLPTNHKNQQGGGRMHQEESDPMQSWWESVSKARSRIQSLLSLLPDPDSDSLSSLLDSDRPARSLLDSYSAYSAVSHSLSGSGDDPLCHWLYDTFHDSDSDSDLRLVVISYAPLVAGLYLSRVHSVSTTTPSPPSPSLAGFEAVLLALYSSLTKSRSGKPLLVSVPTPAYLAHHSSLYHHPATPPSPSPSPSPSDSGIGVGVLCPPLEPQVGIKSTKRPFIVGLAFHSFYSYISQMPSWSKIELCRFAASWAGPHCPCDLSLDLDNDDPDMDLPLSDSESPLLPNSDVDVAPASADAGLIPLPWEVLQPMLRILAHCLMAPPPLVSDDIRDAASEAVRRLYARASHDLSPQAILATRSLLHLHNRASAAALAAAAAAATSTVTTPTSLKKQPEMLLVSQ